MDHDAQFMEFRPLLFRLAYRMMGTRADAEDIVQEAFIRWKKAADENIRSAKSFLTTVVARLSLDKLKAANRTREVYIGTWLPEPIVDPGVEPSGIASIEMAESVSLAFVHLLQSLAPAERVAFLLREVFDTPYDELAVTLQTSEVNCRQMVARAGKHIRENKPRFKVDRTRHGEILQKFLAACASGDPSQLLALLSADVVLHADGGGKVPSALNPIFGSDRVARFFAGIKNKGATTDITARFAGVNGEPGALLFQGDQLASIMVIQLDESDRIAGVFMISNPDKLRLFGGAQIAP